MSNVCRGIIGPVDKNNGSDEKVEGIQMSCSDGTTYRFPTGNREEAMENARFVLNQKGYDADLIDKE